MRRDLLGGALALGLAVVAAVHVTGAARLPSALLMGWCAAAASWIALVLLRRHAHTAQGLRQQAAALDGNRWTMLAATLSAALASLAAVAWALVEAPRPAPPGLLLLGLGTIAMSWLFLQVLFAVHYAHAHWRHGKGIAFPGNTLPDFQEFLYFAFTVGMTFQVSDATTETAAIRRLVLLHGLLAFLFNAVILAAAVNLAAALAG
ncbi:DUF1345 domain-containing protein [Falsiroseomonas tokyonensis]|uniref:DUF1345 domain-containing protein n=1 Tax=Falsiroseomonas tokyonensis TaxID=430521 RepID=A0ABV7BYY3_9PROT|nr:DUF1345 domain-containing protein [Falsiroseomonas tokyonensis]MBU8539268.1 DUF1345 domain-containing protein [Falsiroseomonas tokyonensis]